MITGEQVGVLLEGETLDERRTRVVWTELVDYSALLFMQRPADKPWRVRMMAELAARRGVRWGNEPDSPGEWRRTGASVAPPRPIDDEDNGA